MIYLALYKYKRPVTSLKTLGHRLFDTAVRKLTRGRYSHCEIAVMRPDGLYNCYSSSARDGGVRVKVMNLPTDRWDLIPVDINRNRVKRVYRKHRGKGYDYCGILGFFIKQQSPNRFYCSEFCATVLGLSDTQQSPQSLYLTKRN